MLSAHIVNSLTARIDIPEWQKDHNSRDLRQIIEPFTGKTITEVPVGTAEDTKTAFLSARQKQKVWAEVNPKHRAEIFYRFADLVYQHRNYLMDVLQAETGKARMHALEEILDVMLVSRYYGRKCGEWLKPKKIPGVIPGATRSKVVRKPVGVVGIIAPWNYPLSLAINDAIPAVLAGNAIVLKPDSQTPLTALAAVKLLEQAGLPTDLWQIVTGAGDVVGTEIVANCDYLMFTGSSKTGMGLGEQIGGRLVGYSAELGGKNPMVVGREVDCNHVAEVATRACFSNAGQLCISIERIYAVEDSYEKLVKVLPQRFKKMKIGPGDSWAIEMGSLSGPSQLQTVQTHVQDALDKGARLLCGGKHRPDLGPYFYEPTLLVDVPQDALCYRKETFGPVVSLYPAESLLDAVQQANDTDYGLNSSVFCKTDKDAQWVAQALNTGMVNIKEGYAPGWMSLDGPVGGWGISGIGGRHGRSGFEKYTKVKTIAAQAKWLHLGGPKILPRAAWAKLLSRATQAMKFLPGK